MLTVLCDWALAPGVSILYILSSRPPNTHTHTGRQRGRHFITCFVLCVSVHCATFGGQRDNLKKQGPGFLPLILWKPSAGGGALSPLSK